MIPLEGCQQDATHPKEHSRLEVVEIVASEIQSPLSNIKRRTEPAKRRIEALEYFLVGRVVGNEIIEERCVAD